MELYDQLCDKVRSAIQFQSAMGIVQWDFQTMLPPRGLQQRSEQLALMSRILHQMTTDPEIGTLLSKIEKKSNQLDEFQTREVELVRRNWNLQTALPQEMVTIYAKQKTIATSSWQKAKTRSDWKAFEPDLEKLLELSRARAEYFMEPTETSTPYDALLDIHEPKMTSKTVTSIFTDLKNKLVPLVSKYIAQSESSRINFGLYKVDIETQRALIQDVVNYAGFDTQSENHGGRIDESEHPFTSSYFDDTRMTVHYNDQDVTHALFSGLHEAGHSIQGQSRNPDWKWMFLGEKSSAGINESQARFLENIIGRSPEFWDSYYMRFQSLTNKVFRGMSKQTFLRGINIVQPSKIRVTADELTYALHIIIRYEIEHSLFSDKMLVSEIPQVWNEKYDKYLGVKIENDAEGALQDTHWAWAYWGYFPTYALGNIYSGMFLESLEANIPDWREKLSTGSIETVIDWLRVNIHHKANLYYPEEMLEHITGMKVTAQPFIQYLEKKYSLLFP